MWIHGHSLRVEDPERMDSVVRKGYYIRLDGQANSSNWFHLAVPTAVIVDDNRLRVDSAMLRFRTSGATVTRVHVYDGEHRIAAHDGLALDPGDWAFERFDVSGAPEILWGLGISFKGEFGPDARRRIEVSSAGGDFLP
jgi:hypothetical protein